MTKRYETTITVVIPTFRRPVALRKALDSALSQEVEGFTVKVVVVDNDAFGSARAVAEKRRRVTYLSEPRAGVSNARNTGLAACDSRYVFFLDDDMLAERGCVASLMAALETYEAGVAFAAVHARMPTDSGLHDAMKPFFSRTRSYPEGPTEECLGAGGSLFDLSRCDMPSPAFDPAMNETGGEDDVLLTELRERGTTFAWVPSAHTLEEVPESRATLPYVWKRNFAFGQGPTLLEHDRLEAGERDAWKGIAKWMAVGVAQFALRLPEWLLTMALRMPSRARAHARLAQALGKVFWWSSFRQVLYGDKAKVGAPRTRGA